MENQKIKTKHSSTIILNVLMGFIFLVLLLLSSFTSLNAQELKSSELYKTIKKLDSVVFVKGFNECEISEMTTLLASDLEFYHDKGGLTNSKQEFVNALKKNICGNQEMKPIRKLVENTMEVYPLYNNQVLYGAIQSGYHEFYIKEPNKDLYITGIAKFTHVWILNNDKWILKKVLSYDHQPKNNNSSITKIVLPDAIIEKYTGNYIAPSTGKITILKKDGGLEIKTTKMNLFILPKSETIFFNEQAPLTFEFVSNEKGEVTKMIIKENGKIVEEALRK